MSRVSQLCISIAVLALSLGAQSGPPPPPNTTPPDFKNTQAIGGKIQAGEKNLGGWEEELLREATNYNAYTEKLDNNKFVVKYLNSCKDASGKKTYQCDFKVQGSGDELLASSLLGPNAYEDQNQRQAALDFVKNMTNMVPLDYPGDSTVFKNPKKKEDGLTSDGIDYFVKMFKQIPLLSVTQNSLLALFADRERLPGFSAGLPNSVGKDGAASLLEMLGYEATRRYTNPDWFNAMDNASDSATLHEIAYMTAFQNYLMVKSYEQNARIEALLVAQVTALNNFSAMMNQGVDTKAAQKSIKKYE